MICVLEENQLTILLQITTEVTKYQYFWYFDYIPIIVEIELFIDTIGNTERMILRQSAIPDVKRNNITRGGSGCRWKWSDVCVIVCLLRHEDHVRRHNFIIIEFHLKPSALFLRTS